MGFDSSTAMRQVLRLAQENARRHGHLVEPSHLVLAIVHTSDSGAHRLIQRAIPPDSIEADLLRLVSTEAVQPDGVPAKVPMSPTAKTAVENAISDVMDRDMRWNTSDLLLGILREGSSQTAKVLNDNGMTLELAESLLSNGVDYVD
jgi:ATP-dependent Clp protease ATP-binding subunit ClpA